MMLKSAKTNPVIKPACLRPSTVGRPEMKSVRKVLSIFGVHTHHLHTAYERGYAPHGYRGAGVGMGGSKERPGKGDEVRKSYASPLGKGSPAPPLRKPESLTCRQWPFTLRGEREGLLTLSVTPAHNRG
jgi:hypothetical protein